MNDIIEYWVYPNDPFLGFSPDKTVSQVAQYNWSKVGRLLESEVYLFLTKACPQGKTNTCYSVSAFDTKDKTILWRRSFEHVSEALAVLNSTDQHQSEFYGQQT